MTVKLPEGFVRVPLDHKPAVTFDVPRNRFYLSTGLRREFDIAPGSRVGLAYNRADRQLCVDLNGRAFYVNKQGYISSTHFSKRSYGEAINEIESPIKYARSGQFKDFEKSGLIFFDEV